MTAVRMVVLTCDGRVGGDECPSAYRPEPETDAARVTAVRAAARRHGWTYSNRRDVCGGGDHE